MVHTYSLIHDDLPALDNDDYRRGKLTCHKVFGEATAILAGDALLTLSFQVLANLPRTPPEVKTALVAELSRAAGTVGGMIGGQVVDLEAANNSPSRETLEYIHRAKTAALFRAAVCLGAIAARADTESLSAISRFGENAGLAFQIADDILDVESSRERLGKTAGKDALQKKITYPALYGLERSKRIAAEFVAEAKASLKPFGERGDTLKQLAEYLVSRKA
jgi:geranylgeranyl diphosphate synthase type II